MTMPLAQVVKMFWTMPPRLFFSRVRRRLFGRARQGFELQEVLASTKDMNTQRVHNYLSRYQLILARHDTWRPLDFSGKRVLELGCGPLLGFAPLALFLGCTEYVCIEPLLNPDLVQAPELVERYWYPLHNDLSALYGPRRSFTDFLKDLRAKVVPVAADLQSAGSVGPIDISLSNSCLEHIPDLAGVLRQLAAITTPGGRFLHTVDFGSHLPAKNPFQPLYSVSPQDFSARYGHPINMLRPSEMLDLFRQAGLSAIAVPYYSYDRGFQGQVHPAWTNRFTMEELFTKVVIFADGGRAPGQDASS